jgi:hypothetical protein
MGILEQIPMMSEAKIRASGSSVKNSTAQSQSVSFSPVWLEIILGGSFSRATDLQFRLPPPKLAVQERYNQKMCLSVSSCSLQGIAERPLPCKYNVIQPVNAFHGGNTGSNPVGDAKLYQQLMLVSPVARATLAVH